MFAHTQSGEMSGKRLEVNETSGGAVYTVDLDTTYTYDQAAHAVYLDLDNIVPSGVGAHAVCFADAAVPAAQKLIGRDVY